jgi:hypothetical protein
MAARFRGPVVGDASSSCLKPDDGDAIAKMDAAV